MASRAWTLIVVPPDPRGRTRRLSVAPLLWRILTGFVLMTLAALGIHETMRVREAMLANRELARAQEALAAMGDTIRALRDSAAASQQRAQAMRQVFMPVHGQISSRFTNARRHPILRILRAHRGVDVAAPSGSPIVAPSVGVVRSVGWRVGYGRVVEIDHGNGVRSMFAHCRTILVHAGQQVIPGERIATVGSTGLSTGPHLHFEVLVHGRAVDPISFLARARSASSSFAEVAQARTPAATASVPAPVAAEATPAAF